MTLRELERRFRGARKSLGRRFANAARAFTPNEVIYRLGIREVAGFSIAYRAGTTDERQIDRKSFDNDEFFGGVPEYEIGESDVIVDVGAHIGTFALLAAARVPQGRVYAIEPSEESHNYLLVNLALNAVSNVVASRVAIADRAGTVTLFHREGHWGHSIMTPTGRGEEVEAMTLGAYMDANRIDHCDFMKFNCEGAEFPILLGSPAEVLRRIDVLLVLYHADLSRANSVEELVAHIRGCGFETSIRNRKHDRGWIVARRTG
ncbi:MAG: FkbM family methyltransferase [Longimicrobiales bacterium]